MSNYTAYELEEGAVLEDVEALCAQLTSEGSFTNETQPSLVDVERWITTSYYHVGGLLAASGYATAQTLPAVVGILQEIISLDVALKCELANPITGSGEPNERFLEMRRRRDELIMLVQTGGTLTTLGADESSTGGGASDLLAITGTVKSRKRGVEDDTDYVLPRFRRGFGQNNVFQAAAGESDWYPIDR